MATIVKNWANGDPLTLETSAGGISVLSAPNLTGSDREMDITVRTTNPNGTKVSKVVSLVQGKRDYMSWWEDASGTKHYFDLADTPIINFSSNGNETSPIAINGESVIKNNIVRISFGEGYLGVESVFNYFLLYCTSMTYADIVGLRNTEQIGWSFLGASESLMELKIAGFEALGVIGATTLAYSTLKTVDFSSCINIQVIANNAFAEMPNIERIMIGTVIPPTLGTGVFGGIAHDFDILVPAESVELYKTATNWNQFANRIKAITS